MTLLKCENFVLIFNAVCWTISVAVVLYWAYQYSLDEDLSIVDNKAFYQDPSDRFPVLSLCFSNPFPDANLPETNGHTLNTTNYVKFLRGQYHDDEMLKIDYKKIVMDVSDHVIEVYIKWKNGSYKSYEAKNYGKKTFYPTYSGFGFFQ